MHYLMIVSALFLLVAVFGRFDTPAEKVRKLGALVMFIWGVYEVFDRLCLITKICVALNLR